MISISSKGIKKSGPHDTARYLFLLFDQFDRLHISIADNFQEVDTGGIRTRIDIDDTDGLYDTLGLQLPSIRII